MKYFLRFFYQNNQAYKEKTKGGVQRKREFFADNIHPYIQRYS